MLTVSDKWRTTYPDACIGILALKNVRNPQNASELDRVKNLLEEELLTKYALFDRAGLRTLAPFNAYHTYYKQFKKTYHVQLQLESIVLRGKSIPHVAALVEAMFMAELKNQFLTAGHDLAKVILPIGIHIAEGSESYTRIQGDEQQLKPGDMYIADQEGVLSSVIYGPDQRTCITPDTRQALFTVYGPPGVDFIAMREHLQDIEAFVRLIAPDAVTEIREVYGT